MERNGIRWEEGMDVGRDRGSEGLSDYKSSLSESQSAKMLTTWSIEHTSITQY